MFIYKEILPIFYLELLCLIQLSYFIAKLNILVSKIYFLREIY